MRIRSLLSVLAAVALFPVLVGCSQQPEQTISEKPAESVKSEQRAQKPELSPAAPPVKSSSTKSAVSVCRVLTTKQLAEYGKKLANHTGLTVKVLRQYGLCDGKTVMVIARDGRGDVWEIETHADKAGAVLVNLTKL